MNHHHAHRHLMLFFNSHQVGSLNNRAWEHLTVRQAVNDADGGGSEPESSAVMGPGERERKRWHSPSGPRTHPVTAWQPALKVRLGRYEGPPAVMPMVLHPTAGARMEVPWIPRVRTIPEDDTEENIFILLTNCSANVCACARAGLVAYTEETPNRKYLVTWMDGVRSTRDF